MDFYHPICRKMVASDLGLKLEEPEASSAPPTEGSVVPAGSKLLQWVLSSLSGERGVLLPGVVVGTAVAAGVAALVIMRLKRR